MSGSALHGLSRECWGRWWSYMESDGGFGIERLFQLFLWLFLMELLNKRSFKRRSVIDLKFFFLLILGGSATTSKPAEEGLYL